VGETEITLWRVPGYVGGVPEQPVARDVVAAMVPLSGDQQDNPPAHWSVDLWVDDVDAVVERAYHRGAGGTVRVRRRSSLLRRLGRRDACDDLLLVEERVLARVVER
jgi:hypothetical protein